jgi:CRP/FNR family transcriptional regulator
VAALEARLQKDAALEFQVICKLCHELREAQRHALLLGHRSALAGIAMFFQLLEHHQTARGESANELYLPMNRSDIAAYIGMSLEAVSRSLRALALRGVLSFRGKQYAKVMKRGQLEALAEEEAGRPARRRGVAERGGAIGHSDVCERSSNKSQVRQRDSASVGRRCLCQT